MIQCLVDLLAELLVLVGLRLLQYTDFTLSKLQQLSLKTIARLCLACIQKNILLLLVLNLSTNTRPVVQAGTACQVPAINESIRSNCTARN